MPEHLDHARGRLQSAAEKIPEEPIHRGGEQPDVDPGAGAGKLLKPDEHCAEPGRGPCPHPLVERCELRVGEDRLHPLPLSKVDVQLDVTRDGVTVRSFVRTTAATGVEMEALVAASVAALTVYDMCKALDKGIEIREILLVRKSGGKSGDYVREE